jgi:hypothetical protein
VSRDLKHAVGRRVHNRLSGFEVLLAERLDYLGPGRGAVSEGSRADRGLELLHDLGRKAVGINGERPLKNYPGELPVSRGGVFSGRLLGEGAERSRGIVDRVNPFDVHDSAEP